MMCGKLKNSNDFRHAHKGDFPKFGHICWGGRNERTYVNQLLQYLMH